MAMQILLHVHVYYEEIWPELVPCIHNFILAVEKLKGKIDIFISYPVEKRHMESLLKNTFSDACLMPVENWGYDVSPFLALLNKVDLDAYDYVVKLHTKRNTRRAWCNFHVYNGNEWRRTLLSFCRTFRDVKHVLNALNAQPRLGMVTASRMIDPTGVTGSAHHLCEVKELVRGLGLPIRSSIVTCGTMFIVRARLLKVVQGNFDMDMFRSSPPIGFVKGLHIAIAWECAFSNIVASQGYYVSAGEHKIWAFFRYKFRYVLFFAMRLASVILRGRIRSVKY